MRGRLSGLLLAVYAASTLLFTAVWPAGTELEYQNLSGADLSFGAGELAVMSLNAVYPGIVDGTYAVADSRDNESSRADIPDKHTVSADVKGEKQDGEMKLMKNEKKEEMEPRLFGKDPAVLIVHTHATETYLPAAEGNYHSKEKKNSVRDVGQALAESLEEEGIAVVHDETLHDDPSYSSSYSRSYETIQKLLNQYPTIECVIDLHRDAIASDGTGATMAIAGKNCAKYMYVVSTAVPTYQNNLKFVKALNATASRSYSGFTGSVLERGYPYNQGLSDMYLLLEIGSNRNDIADARNTAAVYGKILAETLKYGTY